MPPIHSTEHPIQTFKSPRCSRSCHFARVALGGASDCPSRASDFLKQCPERLATCRSPACEKVFDMNDNAPAGRSFHACQDANRRRGPSTGAGMSEIACQPDSMRTSQTRREGPKTDLHDHIAC
jgi:hypothetical protein